jgi:hypothetical protein
MYQNRMIDDGRELNFKLVVSDLDLNCHIRAQFPSFPKEKTETSTWADLSTTDKCHSAFPIKALKYDSAYSPLRP